MSGRVLDDAGRPVLGAGVKLGPYTAETDASGAYAFRYVPAGGYDLGLDRNALPADVAWDGREERLTLAVRSRISADLHVAPLNSIHGRVYATPTTTAGSIVVKASQARFCTSTTASQQPMPMAHIRSRTCGLRTTRSHLTSALARQLHSAAPRRCRSSSPMRARHRCRFPGDPKVKPVLWTTPAK